MVLKHLKSYLNPFFKSNKLNKSILHKFFNWEYWPTYAFYIPNLPYAFYLAFRAKNIVFFSAANPSIKSSGNGTESKYQTLKQIPKKYKPKTILVTAKDNFETIIKKLQQNKIVMPIVAKPDVGFRGLLVKKIYNQKQLQEYLTKYPIPTLLQEFLDYKNECGIFYYREPDKNKGAISSITLKRFLSVTGDGTSTIRQLILADERAKRYLNLFEKIHQENIHKTLTDGQSIKLTTIGNHSKGTQFINGNHLINHQLVKTFDELSKSIQGWYYGRVDVKYNNFEELTNGTNFKILEINGIISEPTHIYDAKKGNYFSALKAIRTHWKTLFNVATTNHKKHHIPYKSARKFIGEMFWLKKYIKNIQQLANNEFVSIKSEEES